MDTWVNVIAAGVGAHALYFVISIFIAVIFIAIYTAITPYREFPLIRHGNTAAATSLGGALIGFTLPLAQAVAQSGNLTDMLIWSVVALVAQLLAFLLTRLALPHLVPDVQQGKIAPAVFLAAVSISIGILNAAAMNE